jgi:hypothetical protein
MSFYTGIYIIGPKDNPTDVQVRYAGNLLPLAIDNYVERNVKPDWKKLPTEVEYNLLQIQLT